MSARALAPELPRDLEWVNAREAPRLGTSRGRVVLLNFFSYSNANSLNALADLRHVENKYYDGLTLLGIHCPKFAQERTATKLRHRSTPFDRPPVCAWHRTPRHRSPPWGQTTWAMAAWSGSSSSRVASDSTIESREPSR